MKKSFFALALPSRTAHSIRIRSQNHMCFGDFLGNRTLCDAYHKEHASLPLHFWTYLKCWGLGSRDSAVVRAPAFHQCGLGSILPGVKCGLSLVLYTLG